MSGKTSKTRKNKKSESKPLWADEAALPELEVRVTIAPAASTADEVPLALPIDVLGAQIVETTGVEMMAAETVPVEPSTTEVTTSTIESAPAPVDVDDRLSAAITPEIETPAAVASSPAPAVEAAAPVSATVDSVGPKVTFEDESAHSPVAWVEAGRMLDKALRLVSAAGGRPSAEVDAFGGDSQWADRVVEALQPLYRRYFKVEVRGIENVPTDGGCLLVAGHGGSAPWDVLMLQCALRLDHPTRRRLRPLIENMIFHFPFLGVFLNRSGSVRASPEDAEALLRAGEAVAVFPEGLQGLSKARAQAGKLQRFGRGGFVKLAQKTGVPVIPVTIAGADESAPVLARVERPAAALGLPSIGVTPTLPLWGPVGLLPLPGRWVITFGTPLSLAGSSSDELTVARIAEDIRADMQNSLDAVRTARRSDGVRG